MREQGGDLTKLGRAKPLDSTGRDRMGEDGAEITVMWSHLGAIGRGISATALLPNWD